MGKGAAISTPHPIDLLVSSPIEVICEVKVVKHGQPLYAVREAIGQLLQYRHFFVPNCGNLCVVLDAEPDRALIRFIESVGILIAWEKDSHLFGGPISATTLSSLGVLAA